mmetsp:Transcript_30072/g.39585  ORF Transcript_30072/g.39585 Transcript_30072/m.39585 type:complete len:250 (-) Transcript_30072:285-1034(-)
MAPNKFSSFNNISLCLTLIFGTVIIDCVDAFLGVGRGLDLTKTLVENEVPVPKLIVLDLDKTLWTPDLISFCGGFTRTKDRRIVDRLSNEISMYPDVPEILHTILDSPAFLNSKLAIASRTTKTAWARDVLDLMELPCGRKLGDVFPYKRIYPGSKTSHFKKLRKESKVDYSEMLFFDDWIVNTMEISNTGVTCELCDKEGLTWCNFEKGLTEYAKAKTPVVAANEIVKFPAEVSTTVKMEEDVGRGDI